MFYRAITQEKDGGESCFVWHCNRTQEVMILEGKLYPELDDMETLYEGDVFTYINDHHEFWENHHWLPVFVITHETLFDVGE